MTLKKFTVVDRIEIVENGSVQVRLKTTITENEAPISGAYHRYVVLPGDDYSSQPDKVRAVCAVVHTSDVVATYTAAQKVK